MPETISNDRVFHRFSVQFDANVERRNHATLAGGCYTMISVKKYSIPPGGMVLKDRLQLGNMWRSDHLSRKQTRRELREPWRNNDTFRLDSRSSCHPPCVRRDRLFTCDWFDFVDTRAHLVRHARNVAR